MNKYVNKTSYINQIIKVARIDLYKHIKDKTRDRELWRDNLL